MKTFPTALSAVFIGGLTIGRIYAQISVPQSGLVGYFAGDGNAQDSSSFHNDGSFPNAHYTTGEVGLAFDLSAGPVTIPAIAAYQFPGDFSVGFWFKGSSGNNTFLGRDDGGGGFQKWFIDHDYFNPGRFEIHVNGNSFAFLPANPASVDFSVWNQLTFVKTASEK
jgi:hypothetical protein